MKMLIKIAWRNLWRNKRRTLITASAVAFATVLALFMRSMQFGSYDLMIRTGISQTGNFQVHGSGYWENQSIDQAFFYNDSLKQILHDIPQVKNILPRLETFSLASYGKQTKGVLISGIDPEKEDQQNHISRKIKKGHYLDANSNGALIGDKLAEYLKIEVGDSLVLIGQGYRGMTAYGVVPVRGIFHLPALEMNNQVVYMSLNEVEQFVYPYQPGLLTGLSVFLNHSDPRDKEATTLSKELEGDYEVIPWKTILSEMLQSIELDNVSGQIMLFFLYLIAAFGIFSTVLMMTLEKRKQYAVMVAIGMQRSRLMGVSILETIIVSILGVMAGIFISAPVLIYFYFHPIPLTGEMAEMYLMFNIDPILPFSVSPSIFIQQALIMLGLSLLSALYPIVYLSRFKILKAFRH